ncbi:MAG: hypothetical protein KKD44_15290 [Proteobacteria bacterium]|nr:hypothetical protein [Pseudomonadota bacterium]
MIHKDVSFASEVHGRLVTDETGDEAGNVNKTETDGIRDVFYVKKGCIPVHLRALKYQKSGHLKIKSTVRLFEVLLYMIRVLFKTLIHPVSPGFYGTEP